MSLTSVAAFENMASVAGLNEDGCALCVDASLLEQEEKGVSMNIRVWLNKGYTEDAVTMPTAKV